MNVFLTHAGLEPLIYGIVIFLGLTIMWWKISTGRWLSAVIDITVFWLVFTLHGGTMTGGMAATVAALLAGIIFPIFLRRS